LDMCDRESSTCMALTRPLARLLLVNAAGKGAAPR
jgi:hypothetical protein